ncbi:MAG TPA: ABC transporter ATP-binding protein [Candidatus Limnocylindria bacterium]|nr:ABC transporter ATP-binding protein [Candidatus Limnocylindria bacterium]
MLTLLAVSYRYPGYRRRAIDGIDLAVGGGEIVGLVGPNEAGKSTLCLVAAGLAPGSIGGAITGEVLVDGVHPTARRGEPVAGRVGIVFADPASQLSGVCGSVFEEVAFGPINLGLPVADTVERTRAALAALGIAALAERAPDRLSGGHTQLVAFAAMLAMRPSLLVLDEPVAELDPDGRRLVGATLRSLAGSGTAILIAEHDLDLLASLCTRLVALDAGRMVFDLPIAAALDDPRLIELGVRRGTSAFVVPS